MLLDAYSWAQIAVAVVATLGAGFVRGLTGFGFGILLVPIMALAMPPVEAVLLLNLLAGLLALMEIRYVLREAERSAITISALLVLTVLPGLLLLGALPADIARLLIALVALSAFAAVLLPPRAASVPGPVRTAFTGLSAGILTGFAAMPGPPVVPYYVGRQLPRRIAKASMIGVFGVAAMTGVAAGAVTGLMSWRLALLGALLFPLALLGNRIGSLAFGKVDDRTWRIFVGAVLAAAAIAALVRLL